jgi:hypothetical protein
VLRDPSLAKAAVYGPRLIEDIKLIGKLRRPLSALFAGDAFAHGELFQFPIFQPGAPQPDDMGRLAVSFRVGELSQFRTQAPEISSRFPAARNPPIGDDD